MHQVSLLVFPINKYMLEMEKTYANPQKFGQKEGLSKS